LNKINLTKHLFILFELNQIKSNPMIKIVITKDIEKFLQMIETIYQQILQELLQELLQEIYGNRDNERLSKNT